MFFCGMASRLPSVMVRALMTASMMPQSWLREVGWMKPVTRKRSRMLKPAILLAVERYSVTGVGAPSYTSGAHMWKGTAAILKLKPATTSTSPKMSPALPEIPFEEIADTALPDFGEFGGAAEAEYHGQPV